MKQKLFKTIVMIACIIVIADAVYDFGCGFVEGYKDQANQIESSDSR
ncbi:MAG: hypothetical protein ACRC1T_04205 [Clostridium chrysemydis]